MEGTQVFFDPPLLVLPIPDDPNTPANKNEARTFAQNNEDLVGLQMHPFIFYMRNTHVLHMLLDICC